MQTENSSGRPWLPPLLVAAGCLTGAHVIQAAAGHDWFAGHAFVIAVPISLVAGGLLALRISARTLVDRVADWAVTAAALLLLMLVPQWVKGEIDYGEGLTLQAVRDCGVPTVVAAYVAFYVAGVVGWARLLRDVLGRTP